MTLPRVCMVSALYHPTLGGLGRQAQILAERLRRDGVDLFVIARKMAAVPPAAFSPDVEVLRIPAPFPRTHILEEVTVRNLLVSIAFSLGCLRTLIRNRSRYDLVHFHGASIPLFLSLPILKAMRKKVVAKIASIQGTEAGSLSGRYWFAGNILARSVRRADAFVGTNERIRGGLLRDGVPPGRIRAIPNFIDEELFHPPAPGEKDSLKSSLGYEGKTLVLYTGRLAPVKGLDGLLEAWSRISPGFPDARLLLLGEGPLRASLEKAAARLGIGGTVHLGGRVDDVQEFLRASDLFVLSSLVEGLPNSLLEAMATGVPVVATRVGGVPDVVEDGNNGILVGAGDPAGLGDGIARLLADRPLRERMGDAGLRRIRERYGLDAVAAEYVRLYAELAGDASGRRTCGV